MSLLSDMDKNSPTVSAIYASIPLLFNISALTVLFSIGGYILYYGFLSPLAGIPGPVIARFTNTWVAYHAWKGDLHVVLSDVHEMYGEVVRIGPDEIITTNPEAIKKIYGMYARIIFRQKADGLVGTQELGPNMTRAPSMRP